MSLYMTFLSKAATLFVLSITAIGSYANTDFSQQHPLVSPYEGSSVWKYQQADHIELSFPLDAVPTKVEEGKYLVASGKGYFYQYNTPDNATL